MNSSLPEALLCRVSEFVARHTGLHFPESRFADLERGIRTAASEFGFEDVESCLGWLLSAKATTSQIEILSGHLTVGETYFFREKQSFAILEATIIPELIKARRQSSKRLRIWSAGCSTGEEPYSIAILLRRMLPDLHNWNITILATDINPLQIKKAAAGVYSGWSFRGVPDTIKKKYFREVRPGCHEILPDIKKMVRFSCLNLVEDIYPLLANNTNAMDVILCRNVLMYFDLKRIKKVIDNLYRSLIDEGWLAVSQCEVSSALFDKFQTACYEGALFYRKSQVAREAVIPVPLRAALAEPEVEAPQSPALAPADEYQEALQLYGLGRYQEAAAKLPALLARDPGNSQAMALLARCYANHGDLQEAMEWSRKAVDSAKLVPAYHYLLATILQETGRIQEALLSLRRVLYLDPDFVLAHIALSNLALREGRFGETEKQHQIAIALLSRSEPEDIIPDSEGLTAGRLIQIIRSTKLSWDRRLAEREKSISEAYVTTS